MPTSIEVDHLFDMHVDLSPAQVVASPAGTRMIFAARGGTIEGERIRGKLLPGGGDWLLVGPDRVGRIDVRVTIQTDDGELVFMTNTGIIALGEEALATFAGGGDIAWDEAYIRSAPLFQTGAERYGWLNSVVTVAVNELGLGYVNYRVFEVN